MECSSLARRRREWCSAGRVIIATNTYRDYFSERLIFNKNVPSSKKRFLSCLRSQWPPGFQLHCAYSLQTGHTTTLGHSQHRHCRSRLAENWHISKSPATQHKAHRSSRTARGIITRKSSRAARAVVWRHHRGGRGPFDLGSEGPTEMHGKASLGADDGTTVVSSAWAHSTLQGPPERPRTHKHSNTQ